jgi:hypothetical protein
MFGNAEAQGARAYPQPAVTVLPHTTFHKRYTTGISHGSGAQWIGPNHQRLMLHMTQAVTRG